MQLLIKPLHLREFWLLEIAPSRCPRQSSDEVVDSLCGEEIVESSPHPTNCLE